MKHKLLIILILAVFASFISCKKAPLTVGKTVTESRDLQGFKEVYLYDNINLSLVRANETKIIITTGENIIDNISTKVSDSILTISNTTSCNWIRPYDYELHATLYYKDITNFIFSSSGNVESLNQYNSPDTSVRKHRFVIDDASGDVDLLVNNCRGFYLEYLSGTSQVTLHGNNNHLFDVFKKSFGILDARDFQMNYVDITSNSKGDCYIWATDSIKANISSLGNVYYKGDPEKIQVTYGEFAIGKLLPF